MLKPLPSMAAALAVALGAPGAAHAGSPGLLASPPACPGQAHSGSSRPTQVRAMRCLVNTVRKRAGLPALRSDGRLGRAARLKGGRIAACGEFSHTPCGAPFTATFRKAGWGGRSMGENLAYGSAGPGSPLAILRSWLASPGHRANLLGRSFRRQGIAVRPVTLPGVGTVSVWVNTFGA